MMGMILSIFAILQVIVLLLSPFFKLTWPFSVYYRYVFKPLLKDNKRYRWKFYLVPCFYLSLYTFIVYIFFTGVLPLIKDRLIGLEKVILIPLSIILPPSLGVLSMIIPPETTRKHKKRSLQEYQYDYLLYYPQVGCRTCHLNKPARSKHCDICDNCVLVADHHCIWVNNCIGKGNYVYFYSFLLANNLSMSYAFIRVVHISITRDIETSLPRIALILTILCGSFALICGIFTYLQLDLVKNGMTTNERDKWFTIQEMMREGKLVRTNDNRWFIEYSSESSSLEENEFYSTNTYDATVYHLYNYTTVRDPSEIVNIYDYGSLWSNFKRLCT